MPFVNGKPSKAKLWYKNGMQGKTSCLKGLTKETSEVVRKVSTSLMGHPSYNKELKGCFKKGLIPWNKGTGKERYWNKKEWYELRKSVYTRDNYSCLSCGIVGGRLTMHHLLPVSLFPEYIYEEKNIITLCLKCHTYTDTWGLRLVRKRGELKESLSKVTLSQAREETLLKVQRLAAEAKVNDHASNCCHERPARKGRDSLNLQATVRSNG